jgi:hypothetical protein
VKVERLRCSASRTKNFQFAGYFRNSSMAKRLSGSLHLNNFLRFFFFFFYKWLQEENFLQYKLLVRMCFSLAYFEELERFTFGCSIGNYIPIFKNKRYIVYETKFGSGFRTFQTKESKNPHGYVPFPWYLTIPNYK